MRNWINLLENASKSDPVESMTQSILQATDAIENPIEKGGMRVHEGDWELIFRLADGAVELHMIKIHYSVRKQGTGTMLMKLICDAADRHGIKLILTASNDEGDWLEGWYQGYGFTKVGKTRYGPKMARNPRLTEDTLSDIEKFAEDNGVWLRVFDETHGATSWFIEELYREKNAPKGAGAIALNFLLAAADRENREVSLYAESQDEDLINYYRKFGFEPDLSHDNSDGGGLAMTRSPKQTITEDARAGLF